MPRRHPVVVVRGGHERWREVLARRDVVVRRVGPQHLEHLRVVRASVIRGPGPSDREFVEPEHVHHPDRGERRPEELGLLVQHRADEQPAVRAAGDGEAGRLGDRVVDQELGGGDEVVEDVLLVLQHSRPVPALAVLAAAPQVDLYVDPAAFEEHEIRRIEARGQADVEPAIAVEQGGVVAVPHHVLPVCQEHGDLGAVHGREEHLVRLVLVEVERNLRRPVRLGPAGGEVVAVDRRREEERGEGEVEDVVLPGPAQLSDRADPG